jgi:hypothetical protein
VLLEGPLRILGGPLGVPGDSSGVPWESLGGPLERPVCEGMRWETKMFFRLVKMRF